MSHLPLARSIALVLSVVPSGIGLAATPGAAPPPPCCVPTAPCPPAALPATPAAAAPAGTPVPPPPAAPPEKPARLHVRDGQLLSHPFHVFVTHDIDEAMKPVLHFAGSHLVTPDAALERVRLEPALVAPHQARTIPIAGTDVQVEGTLLVFDLGKHGVPLYKSAVRLLPSLEWQAPAAAPGGAGERRRVVADEEIYLGSLAGAALWTAVTLLLVILGLVAWSYAKSSQITAFKPRPALLLITGSDGFLSLWRTQLLLWTLAVGGMVFLFGLVRLHVPEIPETLVALMGMSLLTGLAAQKAAPSEAPGVAPVTLQTGQPSFADLISSWNPLRGQPEISLPKAQMVFWTALILVLFCVKSLLGGVLWPVPWQLVALTGFSQTGYVGDKFVKGRP